MWQISSHCGEHRVGQPLALGADHERDRRRASSSASGTPSRGTSADAPAGQLRDRAHARERDREQRAHRRPHRLVAVRIGRARAERDAAGAERERRAQHRADVAGIVDAPQRDAQRPGRRGRPALAVDGERARARAELGDLAPAAARATSSPASPEPSATSRTDGCQPAASAASSRSSPSATNSPSLSRHLRPASLRISLRVSLCGLVIMGLGQKKGARPVGGAPGASVSSALRPRTPRGRSGQIVGTSRHRARRCRPGPCGRARCRPASGRA